MATFDATKNFAKATVSIGYAAGATSIVLAAGHGANLPEPSTDGEFNLVWWNKTSYGDPSDDPNREIVRCTARSTDTLTVTRAQESTSDTSKNTADKAYEMALTITAKTIDDLGTAIPDKAIGTEVDTGTDDAKFTTAKAISDSKISFTENTETLKNKRIEERVTTITSSATPTVNTDNCDNVTITALAVAITSMTSGLSGTPTNFQRLTFRFLDNGTARVIAWGTSFQAMGTALPLTTVASKVTTVGFIYDSVDAKWGCVASSQEA